MSDSASSLPKLWSSSLQETHASLQTSSPDANSLDAEDIPDLGGSTSKQKLKKVVNNPVFQYSIALAGVFLVNFILLVAIRPSFTYTKPDEEHKTRQFSASKAALWALFFTVLGIITMVIVLVVSKVKLKKQIELTE